MTALSSVPAGDEFERQLAAADPDMLRLMVKPPLPKTSPMLTERPVAPVEGSAKSGQLVGPQTGTPIRRARSSRRRGLRLRPSL